MPSTFKGKSKKYWNVVKSRLRKDRKKTNAITVKDHVRSDVNPKPRILDLYKFNRGPINMRERKTLKWDTYFQLACAVNTPSNTRYFSLSSLYRPDYAGTTTNGGNSARYFNYYCGTSEAQYQYYRVNYVDCRVKVINTETGTYPKVVCSGTAIGLADFPSTLWIPEIANRPNTISKELEYNGDTAYKTMTFRMYPHKVLNIKWQQYQDLSYRYTYNTASSTPFLAISIGDLLSPIAPGQVLAVAQSVYCEVTLEYNVTFERPSVI